MTSSFITTIGGKRCTAIPKNGGSGGSSSTSSSTTTTSEAAAVQTTSSPAPPPPAVAPAIQQTTPESANTSTSVAVAAAATTTPPPDTIPPETTPSAAAASTPTEAPAAVSIPPAIPTVPSPQDPIPAAATTTSSSNVSTTPRSTVVAQSEVRPSETSSITPIETTTFSSIVPSPTTAAQAAPASASASAGISSSPKLSAAPVVGGVMGGVAFVGILFFLWWQYKKRRGRNSMLTPLTPQSGPRAYEKYEIDNESVGPTARREIWKAQAGGVLGRLRMGFADTSTSIRSKFGRDTRSVNLNRGNSQFIEAIPQHSRSNSSAMSAGQGSQLTTRDKFSDWWTRFTEDVNFNWRLRNLVSKNKDPVNSFTSTRGVNEKETSDNQKNNPDFSQFLAMKDSELRQASDRRRNSLSAGQSGLLGSLGLDFSASMTDDPFADPISASNQKPTIPKLAPGAETLTLNPFVDPPTRTVPAPKPTASQPANYVADMRRSRGQSVSAPNPSSTAAPASRLPSVLPAPRYPSTVPGSRYPSTIRTNNSHDSFRSSTFSMNPRKKAGRSDPFDLETLELARPSYGNAPPDNYPPQNIYAGRNSGLSRISQSPTSSIGAVNGGSDRAPSTVGDGGNGSGNGMQPRVVSVQTARPRIVSEAGTYSSKYSSGASGLLSEWGEPGPDLGPGSGGLNRAIGSQRAVIDGDDDDSRRESDFWDLQRKDSSGSGKSVGKAM